jgi:type IV pilus assembly protein PilW
MNDLRNRRSGAGRQRGVTIVELMIAMLLGLLITGGVIQVFVANRTTYAFNEGLSRLQENGRFALDTLGYRIRLSGHLGCLWGVPVTNNLNAPTSFTFNFAEGLFGYEATGTGPGDAFNAAATNPANEADATNWAPTLPAEVAGRVIPGSDVIVVRNGSGGGNSLISPFNTSGSLFVDAAAGEFQAGDIAIAADCQKASVFQVTGVTDTGTAIRLDHTAAGTPGNATAAWGVDQEYAIGAEVVRAETWVYYVGTPAAGGPPSLFQQRISVNSGSTTAALAAEELVDSVDTMQVLYGVDAALDGAVDQYVTADAVADWDTVVTVRASLVMRSPQEYGNEIDDRNYVVNEVTFNPVDDRRERQVFTTTIALRNRLP